MTLPRAAWVAQPLNRGAPNPRKELPVNRLSSVLAIWLVSLAAASRAAARTPTTSDLAPALASVVGPPSPGGLTADQAAERAARTSREAGARVEDVAGAAAQVRQAHAAFVPRLTGSA